MHETEVNSKIYSDALELVGNTPLVRINRLTTKTDANILVKLENFNVGGSVKDRISRYMIEEAKKQGKLQEGMTILEATSGNTGIGLAVVSAVMGYKLVIVMPDNVSLERRRLLQSLGVEVILTPGEKGTAGAIETCIAMARSAPDTYFVPDQFNNSANVKAHYETTGMEIWQQTQGKLDMLVVGIGTSGTAVGTGSRLKELKPDVKVVGVEPVLGEKIQGMRNLREPFPPSIFDPKIFDERMYTTLLESIVTARELARKEGLVMGMSSGAVLSVALKKARELGAGKNIVAILPDGGERYLSTDLYNQQYSPSGIVALTEH